jgi:hypothetical protein
LQLHDDLILQKVFGGNNVEFATYQTMNEDAKALLWNAKTEKTKLSDFAEEFFRKLQSEGVTHRMLLRKGQFHVLVSFSDAANISSEVIEKLDVLQGLFQSARQDS